MKKLFSSFMVTLLISSCAKKNLLDLERAKFKADLPTMLVNAQYCTLPPNTEQDNTFTTVLFDSSGSNKVGNNANGFPTDENGKHRFESLSEQLQVEIDEEVDNTSRFFTAFDFNCPNCEYGVGRDAQQLPGLPQDGDFPPFTNDIVQFKNVIDAQTPRGDRDDGGTNLFHALDTMYELIRSQALKAKERFENEEVEERETASHQIVLITDGKPTDYTPVNDNPADDTYEDWKEHIDTAVKKIMDLKKDIELSAYLIDIRINAGFYYNENAYIEDAERTVKRIAELGQGEFYRFNTSKGTINWRSLLFNLAKNTPTEETLMLVRNMSAGFDRALHTQCRDTDTDGLCDSLEEKLGSDPLNWDSDGNGYSDKQEVELFNHRLPCNGLFFGRGCNPQDAVTTIGCFETAETKEYAGRIKYYNGKEIITTPVVDSDFDGISDCFERQLKSDHERPDTNNNGLPDGIDFLFDLQVVFNGSNPDDPGVPASNIDSDNDGMNDRDEIFYGYHPKIANQLLPSVKKLEYNKEDKYNHETGQTCFELNVSEMSIFDPNNDVIEITRFETEEFGTGMTYYLRAMKKIENGSVTFTDADFRPLYGPQRLLKKLPPIDSPANK